MTGLLASPRRRRRATRIGAVLGFVIVIAVLLTVVFPNQGGQTRAPDGGGVPQKSADAVADPQTEQARAAAEAATLPLAAHFYRDVVGRSNLGRAYFQLAADLRERYERNAWLRGDGLPLGRGSSTSGSRPLVAFSGAETVGFVISSDHESDTILTAVRFVREAVSYTHLRAHET